MKKLYYPILLAIVFIMLSLAAVPAFAGGSRAITLISPGNGATLSVGQKVHVSWSYVGYPDNAQVNVILWQNGIIRSHIAQTAPIHSPEYIAGRGGFWWTLGQQDNGKAVAGCGYSVSAQVKGYPGESSLKSVPFCVSGPGQQASITVLSPNGGEKWMLGRTNDIRWSAPGVSGKVKISLRKAGWTSDRTIGNDLQANAGIFSWKAGDMLPPNGDIEGAESGLKIVVQTLNGQFSDESNAAFSLVTPIVPNNLNNQNQGNSWIRITSPKGGEVVLRDNPFFIRWNFSVSLQGKTARIQLLKPDGSFYREIEAKCPLSIDDFRWNVPGKELLAAGSYKIRMQAVDFPAVMADSSVFSLAADENEIVTSPIDNFGIKPGQYLKIVWNKNYFSTAKVKAELYSADKKTRIGKVIPIMEGPDIANDGMCETIVGVPAGYQENKHYRIKVSESTGKKGAWSGDFHVIPLQKVEMKGTFGTPSFVWFHIPRGEHAVNRRFNPYLAGRKSDGEGTFIFRTYLLADENFRNWDIAKAEVKVKFVSATYSSGMKNISFCRRDGDGFEQNSPHTSITSIAIPDDLSQVVSIDVTGLLKEVAAGTRVFYGFLFRGMDGALEGTWAEYCSLSDLKLEVTYYVKK